MSKIEDAINNVRSLIRKDSPKLTEHVTAVRTELEKQNRSNLEAHLLVRHVDMCPVQVDWSRMQYGEHYETDVSYNVSDLGEDYESLTRDQFYDLRDRLSNYRDELNTVLDAAGALKLTGLEPTLTKALEALDHGINADPEYPELMWNTMWRPYGDDVDKAIIDRIPGITWVDILDNTDQFVDPGTYMTLTTIGQDMGPSLMAYVVLSHGIVPSQYVRYWTDLEYTQYVIGKSILAECAEKLGVTAILDRTLARNARQKEIRRQQAERREARLAARRQKPLPARMKCDLLLAFLADNGACVHDQSPELLKTYPASYLRRLNLWPSHTTIRDALTEAGVPLPTIDGSERNSRGT